MVDWNSFQVGDIVTWATEDELSLGFYRRYEVYLKDEIAFRIKYEGEEPTSNWVYSRASMDWQKRFVILSRKTKIKSGFARWINEKNL